MSNLVEAVPVSISTRSATIQIINKTNYHILTDPKVFLISGGIRICPTSSIKPMESQFCSFVKTNQSLRGSVGVLTYELNAMQSIKYKETLAIMFSVPYDYNLFSNWFSVGIFESVCACDNNLFHEMYYNYFDGRFARSKAGSQTSYEGKFHSVKANMSDFASAILTVELLNKVV